MIRDKVVTFILVRPSGEMLMQLRDDGRGKKIEYPNMWCFPGGGMEKGEEPIEASIREIREEYGIEIQRNQCELLTVYNHDDDTDYVFICKVGSDAVPVLHEGADMKWFNIDAIKQLPLAWGQEKITPTVEGYLKSNP